MTVHRIPESFIQEVLKRTDLTTLIQPRVDLKKRGQDYWGLCPFHEEKTPSFTVSPQKQFYYCFGCQAHGNAIRFLMAFDRMEFTEAVRYLAEQLGLEYPSDPEASALSIQRAEDYQLLKEVSRYYRARLKSAPQVIRYLRSRGITGQSAQRFALGYAPVPGDHLQHLITTASREERWIANGLWIRKDKARPGFARFRDRLMFPIRDVKGNVIAFGGRALGQGLPKYMNSPETALFHKSHELYGLYEALLVSRSLSRLLVVEGYLDVISLHQYQITEVVATLGTAINARHLQKLLRYTQELIYCFDGDSAGRQAAWRALAVSLPLMRDDIRIRFLYLPTGEDPDSFVRQVGAAEFEKKIQEAVPLSEVWLQRLQEENPIRSLEDKAQFAKRALQSIETLPKALFRRLLIERVAEYLCIDVQQLLNGGAVPAPLPAPPKQINRRSKLPPLYFAMALLLQYPHLASKINPLPDIAHVPGAQLLIKLVDFLKKDSTVRVGAVLAAFDNPEESEWISKLAVYSIPLSKEEELLAELNGAFLRLGEQEAEFRIEILIEKAKISELSAGEQKTLNNLLVKVKQ